MTVQLIVFVAVVLFVGLAVVLLYAFDRVTIWGAVGVFLVTILALWLMGLLPMGAELRPRP